MLIMVKHLTMAILVFLLDSSIDSHGIYATMIPAHLLMLLKSTGVSVIPIRPLSVSHSCFTHTEMRSVVATKTIAMMVTSCSNDRVCLFARKGFITESDIKENFSVRDTAGQKWNTD